MDGVEPTAISYERSGAGKPRVVGSALQFSVSHSGSGIVIAVGRVPVGVDIEAFGRDRLALEVAARYFPAEEARWLAELPADCVAEKFLRLWVSKEAALKCLGTGLAGHLERAVCEREAGGRVSAVGVDGRIFSIEEFELDGFGIGALATEGNRPRVRFLKPRFD